jgi:hypothetical protein
MVTDGSKNANGSIGDDVARTGNAIGVRRMTTAMAETT